MSEATPWIVGRIPQDEEPDTCIIGSDCLWFCRVVGSPKHPAEERATLIVRAVNAHDALAAACKATIEFFEYCSTDSYHSESKRELCDQLHSALALARTGAVT